MEEMLGRRGHKNENIDMCGNAESSDELHELGNVRRATNIVERCQPENNIC